MTPNVTLLSPEQCELLPDALIVDMRLPDHFEKGFIAQSQFIGFTGEPDKWLPVFIEKDRSLIVVCEQKNVNDIASFLQHSGYKRVLGFVVNPLSQQDSTPFKRDMVISIHADELICDLKFLTENEKILDVRSQEERDLGFVEGSMHLPLDNIEQWVWDLSQDTCYYIYCSGGYRSMIAASYMKRFGKPLVKVVSGGFARIQAEQNKRK
jgi:hydroxyacylglutathione hydrolase